MKKHSLALLLALIMLFSLLPAPACAADGDITVTVSIENLTKTTENGAAWTGKLLGDSPVSVTIPAGSTALYAVKTAVENASEEIEEYGGFISSIGELANGDYTSGDSSGWIGAVNGGVPNVGLGSIKLFDSGAVRMVYSDSTGSINSYGLSWSQSNASTSGFGFSTGIQSYVSGDYGNTLYLTMPVGTTELTVNDIPGEPGEDYTSVAIYPYDTAAYAPVGDDFYVLNAAITLDDSFDALLIVLDNWAVDYTIKLRTTAEIDVSALTENSIGKLQGGLDYWKAIAVYAAGGEYTPKQKQLYINDAIDKIPDQSAGVLAMQCIALNAMGCDPAQLKDAVGTEIDTYALLAACNFGLATDSDLAYAIIALLHAGDTYKDKIASLTETLASHQQDGGTWPDPWGFGYETDMTATALTALAMANSGGAYNSNLANGLAALDALKAADGSFKGSSSVPSGNANTTALALIALEAANADTDGNALLLYASGDDGGFVYSGSYSNCYDPYATKQALTALAALGTGSSIFDFTDGEKLPAAADALDGAAVNIATTPKDATVAVEGQSKSSAGYYDLPAGIYIYTVSKSGYETKSDSFTVTADDVSSHKELFIPVTLTAKSPGDADEYIYITVKAPNETLYSRKKMLFVDDMTPLSAILNTGLDVEYKSNGYVTSVEDYEEFGQGVNSGWLYKVNGDEGILSSAGSYMLKSNDELVWFYTIDFTKETGSSSWSGGSAEATVKKNSDGSFTVKIAQNGRDTRIESGVVVTLDAKDGQVPAIVTADGQQIIIGKSAFSDGKLRFVLQEGAKIALLSPQPEFSDVPQDSTYYDDVCFAAARGLMLGVPGDEFNPDTEVTREMAVTVLHRLQGLPTSGTSDFADVSSDSWFSNSVGWAYDAGVVRGNGTEFGTGECVTRQEIAVMLHRYCSILGLGTKSDDSLGSFPDSGSAADWAKDALGWAIKNDLITGSDGGLLDPNGSVTRAELVSILHKLTELIVS